MSIKIGLIGNPNCGKTTMFNGLTGSSQYVGNWPGVTVEKKGGKLKGNKDVEIVDLPGIYSLSPYTLEEVVIKKISGSDKTRTFLNSIGFVVGTNVKIVSKIDGNLLIDVKDTRVALDKKMASRIII